MNEKLGNLSSTNQKLKLLLFVFVCGFLLLIGMHMFFIHLIGKLDTQTANLKTKIQIGEFIAEDIYKIRSDFFEIATSASNQRGRELIKDRLEDRVLQIKKMLDIIDHGGDFDRIIRLNVANQNDTTKHITYLNMDNTNVSIESIDVRPKLDQLITLSDELLVLLQKKDELLKAKDGLGLMEHSKEISRFYKVAPAFFIRMTENIRRLLYEGDLELNQLTADIETKKSFYAKLELGLIAFIILLVLSLGFIISKQITKSNQKLRLLNDELEHNVENLRIQEVATRGILNAQPNIVIVSNGTSMQDANKALFDFFDQYQNLEEFKKEHYCLCEFFVELGNEYVVNKDYDGMNWAMFILNNPKQIHRAAMYKDGELHHFIINVEQEFLTKSDMIIVVTLTDITNEIIVNQQLKDLNNNLEGLVSLKTQELQALNEDLEERVKQEVEKNRQKERQILQQSRSAALGEMIANIAHQWRQPLSAISSTSSSIQLQMQLHIASEEEINKAFSDIMNYVGFLTQTIEDFRGYFKEDKEKVEFLVNDILDKTLGIVGPSIKDANIEIIKQYDDNENVSYGYPNELSQVFLNVINNARDATLNNKIENRYIHLTSVVEDDMNVIYVQDNAGGISDDIMAKIFDPYFTTKHQSQGTGIGLYMSRDIIEKHMLGSISVENKSEILDGKLFNGACFRIAVPQNSCSLETIG